jgi:hypothetical protein
MDFLLTLISIILQVAISVIKVARTARLSRLLRTIRVSRGFDMCKYLKKLNIIKFLVEPLQRIQILVKNIVTCFPIVMKLTVILFMLTYTYAVIGLEIFNESHIIHEESEFVKEGERYSGFDDIGSALLTLFHIINEATWTDVEFDYIQRFGGLAKVSYFFNSYHALANLVVISLLTGLIWEVFTFMSQNLQE